MPYHVLHQHFSRRMLPLAVAAGLVVALVPPLSYAVVTWPQMEAQAAIYARQIATAVQASAEHQPYLWRYNAPKILQATTGHRAQRDIGTVTVTDCGGRVVFGPSEMAIGTGRGDGPRGEAPVMRGHAMVARVAVRLDHHAQLTTLGGLAGAAGLAGLFVGALLFWFPTRVVRRQARELAETVRRLEEAEAHLTGMNEELNGRVRAAVREVRGMSGRVVGIQEEERLRIARDLHDGVGQAVTALQIELRLMAGSPDGRARHLAEASRLAEEVLAEIRQTVMALRPAQLAEGGFAEALGAGVERFELRTGIPASLRTHGDLSMVPGDVATAALRILQEALTNVSRHAGAGEVGVVATVGGGTFALEVRDDGCGFDPARAGGSGILGMRERATFFGGTAEVGSADGEGTRVRVVIPLTEGWR